MRTIGFLCLCLCVAFADSARGFTAEAWLLRMPQPLAETLKERYQDPAQRESFAASLAQIPRLAKQRRLTVLEKFTGAKTGTVGSFPEHFAPEAKVYLKGMRRARTNQPRDFAFREVFHYGPGLQSGTRTLVFRQYQQNEQRFFLLTATTGGELGPDWAPTALLRHNDDAYLLLERDPSAPPPAAGVAFALTVQADQGEVTWHLLIGSETVPQCFFQVAYAFASEEKRAVPVFEAGIELEVSGPSLRCRFAKKVPTRAAPSPEVLGTTLPFPSLEKPTTRNALYLQKVTKKATIFRFLPEQVSATVKAIGE